MPELPEPAKDLLKGKNFAHVATLMPDGSPQVTPVWIDHEGDTIVFNTAKGRLKHTNLERDGRVALSVFDQENPYAMFTVQGKVAEITDEGADPHIDSLAKRYMGVDEYPMRQPGEVRLIVRITPEKVNYFSPE